MKTVKEKFLEACVNSNSVEELQSAINADNKEYLYESDVKNGWEGLSFDEWKEAINEAIIELNEA